MTIKMLVEIAIGTFGGYCCCYFMTMNLLGTTPGELFENYLKNVVEKLERSGSREE